MPGIGSRAVVVVVESNLEDEAMGKRRVLSHENVTGRTSCFDNRIDNVRFFSGGYDWGIVIDEYFSFFKDEIH